MWRQMERKGWSVAVGRMVEPAKEQNPKRGGRLLLKKDGFRVSFFFCVMLSKLPPLEKFSVAWYL
jgi:hypothetical protein